MAEPAPIAYEELNAALKHSRPEFPSISSKILHMFLQYNELNAVPPIPEEIQRTRAAKRFHRARKLYQSIRDNRPGRAVFYRIPDLDKLEGCYHNALLAIAADFQKMWHERGALSVAEINQFFSEQQNLLRDSPVMTMDKEDEEAEYNILTLLIADPDKKGLEDNIPAAIDEWFAERKKAVSDLAEKVFYKTDDLAKAFQTGIVYAPKNDHNWGVNVAWALRLAQDKVPIEILSSLESKNRERSHPNPTSLLNPSAFALEISIAIKMGYGLTINGDAVSLLPPDVLNSALTNGEVGNGAIPGLQEQLDIYDRCVRAQALYRLISLNKGEDLGKAISAACTGGTEYEKLEFIHALELLRKGKSLAPILNALNRLECQELNALLKTEPFLSNKSFDLLRVKIHTEKLDILIEGLKDLHVAEDQGESLRQYIYDVCVGTDESAKEDLVDALVVMNIHGVAWPILTALKPFEHTELQRVLSTPLFAEDEEYSYLREVECAAQEAAIALMPRVLPLPENMPHIKSQAPRDVRVAPISQINNRNFEPGKREGSENEELSENPKKPSI